MEVGLSTLYNIGFNYSLRLNDEEILVYEDDTLIFSWKKTSKRARGKREARGSRRVRG